MYQPNYYPTWPAPPHGVPGGGGSPQRQRRKPTAAPAIIASVVALLQAAWTLIWAVRVTVSFGVEVWLPNGGGDFSYPRLLLTMANVILVYTTGACLLLAARRAGRVFLLVSASLDIALTTLNYVLLGAAPADSPLGWALVVLTGLASIAILALVPLPVTGRWLTWHEQKRTKPQAPHGAAFGHPEQQRYHSRPPGV